jgi:predicted HicB family RNase H-like nuclease
LLTHLPFFDAMTYSDDFSATDTDLKKLSVQLPRDVHQQLKMFAIRQDTSITALIQDLVEDLLRQAGAV